MPASTCYVSASSDRHDEPVLRTRCEVTRLIHPNVRKNRSALLAEVLSSASINLRLSPLRKLAREMADNGMLEPSAAAAIERVPGVERRGTRIRNWRTKDQADDLLNAPDPRSLTEKRDRAILALLIGCCQRDALRNPRLFHFNSELRSPCSRSPTRNSSVRFHAIHLFLMFSAGSRRRAIRPGRNRTQHRMDKIH